MARVLPHPPPAPLKKEEAGRAEVAARAAAAAAMRVAAAPGVVARVAAAMEMAVMGVEVAAQAVWPVRARVCRDSSVA